MWLTADMVQRIRISKNQPKIMLLRQSNFSCPDSTANTKVEIISSWLAYRHSSVAETFLGGKDRGSISRGTQLQISDA